jgi:hypothetical protein
LFYNTREINNVGKERMEKLMNEENEWDGEVETGVTV